MFILFYLFYICMIQTSFTEAVYQLLWKTTHHHNPLVELFYQN